MRKTRLLRTTVIALAVLTAAFGMTACGKKNKVTENTTTTTENVSEADKNNEKKPTKVVFDYTDTEGNTVKLEGNATVNDKGEATIEVVDEKGNKTVFTGKANTENGKLSVNDIKVTEGGTLVKTDGTEIKVTEDAKIEDATESTEETKADIAAKEEPKEDVIVADGGNTTEGTGNDNTGDNGADNGNVSNTPSKEPVETPDVPNTPSEPEYVPDVPDNGNDNGGEDTGNTGSNTGNNFYDNFINGGYVEGSEDLIDKDSDPSKPCPYPLNTPIEGTYNGVDEDGVYGTYPVYIVYTIEGSGVYGMQIVRDTCYGGKSRVNGKLIVPYETLVIGEYNCGAVRASYLPRV